MTGWAMLGLESAGINPLDVGRRGHTPVDYLRRNLGEVRTAGDLARTILALRGAGIDPHHFAGHDLAARLAGRRRADGSYEEWPNSTAFGVMALRASGMRGRLGRSLAWLREVQNADGGWGAVRGSPSDPDSTGAVLQALRGDSRAARRAVRLLRHSQHSSGGWALAASGPVNSQSTAWAIQGLLAAGVDPSSVERHGRTGLDYLASRRARNGHYRYSSSSDQTPVWVTGQVLAAVNLEPFPLSPVPRAAGSEAHHGDRASAAGSGKGGAAAPPERFAGERAQRRGDSPGGTPSEAGVREGSGTAPPPDDPGAAPHDLASSSADADQGGSGDRGGTSPLVPIGIALAAGGLVVGGTWIAARRFIW
jgi:hypothetical protein